MLISFSSWILPSPKHFLHGVSITVPSPLQLLHVVIFTNCPNTEREIVFTSPVPWHTGQVFVEVPASAPVPLHSSHLTCFLIFIFFVTPVAISSRESSRLTFRSDPGVPLPPLVPVLL
jgi:hypothetical protein